MARHLVVQLFVAALITTPTVNASLILTDSDLPSSRVGVSFLQTPFVLDPGLHDRATKPVDDTSIVSGWDVFMTMPARAPLRRFLASRLRRRASPESITDLLNIPDNLISDPASRVSGGTMVDLGTLGGDSSVATSINSNGAVTGHSHTASGKMHAFRWTPTSNAMQDLGTLGGDFSRAHSIGDQGLIVGASETTQGHVHAFLWSPRANNMRDLGTLGGDDSRAWDVNALGQVVGLAQTKEQVTHAFVWDPKTSQMRDLGTLGGKTSGAYGINDQGLVVGYSETEQGDTHAFLWDPKTETMRDLDTGGGKFSYALGINSQGQIAGYAQSEDRPMHAVVWDVATGETVTLNTADLKTADLNTVDLKAADEGPSRGYAINDKGRVIGLTGLTGLVGRTGDGGDPGSGEVASRVAGMGTSGEVTRAIRWDSASGIVEQLGTLGGESSVACDINADGLVVGYAQTASSDAHAFLWRPAWALPVPYDSSGYDDLSGCCAPSGWNVDNSSVLDVPSGVPSGVSSGSGGSGGGAGGGSGSGGGGASGGYVGASGTYDPCGCVEPVLTMAPQSVAPAVNPDAGFVVGSAGSTGAGGYGAATAGSFGFSAGGSAGAYSLGGGIGGGGGGGSGGGGSFGGVGTLDVGGESGGTTPNGPMAVPEPSTLAIWSFGALCLVFFRRRQRR